MKRITIITLILALIFCISGCSSGGTSKVTEGQTKALESAKTLTNPEKSPLPLSYNGLKGVLERSGYKLDEVNYALDNCKADWKANALSAAKFLSETENTREYVITNLKELLYTQEEIEYAVNKLEDLK